MGCSPSKEEEKRSKAVDGVGRSKAQGGGKKGYVSKELPKLDENGRMTQEEIKRRTSNSLRAEALILGTEASPIKVEFAHWTQRGYYPDDPHKENQDEFSITKKFAGVPRDAVFAVYDGHGGSGHDCARYTRTKLPPAMAKHMRQSRVAKFKEQLKKEGKSMQGKQFDPKNWPTLNAEEYKAACAKAFMEVNRLMNKNEEIQSKMSGTTAIVAAFHRGLLTVCNVGDSRAVLGHKVNFTVSPNMKDVATKGGKLFPDPRKMLAIPLSRDQTPYRRDERERVQAKGASIMSVEQVEGRQQPHDNWGDMVLGDEIDVHGDPPRVWMQGKDYPGTAFTRSIGDELAESIGVTAEPEMLACELTSNDHVLVLASDGLFEFLTNQEVINLCIQCSTPLAACEALVSAAYNQWLAYGRRTDDITVIVCFLTVDKKPPNNPAGTTESLIGTPVRKPPKVSAPREQPQEKKGFFGFW